MAHVHPSPLMDLMQARLDRRAFLRGTAMTAGAVLLSGCGNAFGSTAGGGPDETSLGSNYSDQFPKDALAEVLSQYESQSGMSVAVNTVDHNTYQEQMNNYLQANPQDVIAWFAGFRMQFFAERDLASPVTDVWQQIGSQYTEGVKESSSVGDEQFFVPFIYYPWGFFYRKSLFEERGYEVPTKLDEFVTLGETMKRDGLAPIAFSDKDGWPAMGTFDYLNLRTNGFEFHKALMAGDEAWDSRQVKDVFATWRDLLPLHQGNALGREWQEAAQTLVDKESGMYLLGLFVAQQFPDEERGDLDFFPFPEINSEFGQGAVEAPIDGWMLAKKPRNEQVAKDLLAYLGTAEAQEIYDATDPGFMAVSTEADRSGYTDLNKKAIEVMQDAENVSQFMDRDTRPDFAATVMIPSLQQFLRDPNNIDGLLRQVELQKQSIFGR